MNAVRVAWTDDRLDDLANRMDAGFDRVDRDIREVRAEMKAGFDAVDRRFESTNARFDARFDAMNARLDGLHRTLLQVGGGLATVVIASTLANHL